MGMHRLQRGRALALALVVGLVEPAAAQILPLGAPAPEIAGGPWINSTPLTLSTLRGRVVLIDFWTYG